MGLGRRKLNFWAMCVLYETSEAADRGAVPPSLSLRLALAVLYELGDRRAEWFDREPYDDFWREVTRPIPDDHPEEIGRWQVINASLNGIARAAGFVRTPDFDDAIKRARRKNGAGQPVPDATREPGG